MGGGLCRFWRDEWVNREILISLLPRMYLILKQKEVIICEIGLWREERWCWDLRWRRATFKWEMPLL